MIMTLNNHLSFLERKAMLESEIDEAIENARKKAGRLESDSRKELEAQYTQ